LARVLRWGPGFTGGTEDLTALLNDIIVAEDIQLDRSERETEAQLDLQI